MVSAMDHLSSGSIGPSTIPLDLKAVWIACHYQKKLAKKQIVDADIRLAVERIVELTAGSNPSLRIVGGLLVGVTRLYERKVEYFQLNCGEILHRMQQATLDATGRRRGSSTLARTVGSLGTGRKGKVPGPRKGSQDVAMVVCNGASISDRLGDPDFDVLAEYEREQEEDARLFAEVTRRLAEPDPLMAASNSLPSARSSPAPRRRKKPALGKGYQNDMYGSSDDDADDGRRHSRQLQGAVRNFEPVDFGFDGSLQCPDANQSASQLFEELGVVMMPVGTTMMPDEAEAMEATRMGSGQNGQLSNVALGGESMEIDAMGLPDAESFAPAQAAITDGTIETPFAAPADMDAIHSPDEMSGANEMDDVPGPIERLRGDPSAIEAGGYMMFNEAQALMTIDREKRLHELEEGIGSVASQGHVSTHHSPIATPDVPGRDRDSSLLEFETPGCSDGLADWRPSIGNETVVSHVSWTERPVVFSPDGENVGASSLAVQGPLQLLEETSAGIETERLQEGIVTDTDQLGGSHETLLSTSDVVEPMAESMAEPMAESMAEPMAASMAEPGQGVIVTVEPRNLGSQLDVIGSSQGVLNLITDSSVPSMLPVEENTAMEVQQQNMDELGRDEIRRDEIRRDESRRPDAIAEPTRVARFGRSLCHVDDSTTLPDEVLKQWQSDRGELLSSIPGSSSVWELPTLYPAMCLDEDDILDDSTDVYVRTGCGLGDQRFTFSTLLFGRLQDLFRREGRKQRRRVSGVLAGVSVPTLPATSRESKKRRRSTVVEPSENDRLEVVPPKRKEGRTNVTGDSTLHVNGRHSSSDLSFEVTIETETRAEATSEEHIQGALEEEIQGASVDQIQTCVEERCRDLPSEQPVNGSPEMMTTSEANQLNGDDATLNQVTNETAVAVQRELPHATREFDVVASPCLVDMLSSGISPDDILHEVTDVEQMKPSASAVQPGSAGISGALEVEEGDAVVGRIGSGNVETESSMCNARDAPLDLHHTTLDRLSPHSNRDHDSDRLSSVDATPSPPAPSEFEEGHQTPVRTASARSRATLYELSGSRKGSGYEKELLDEDAIEIFRVVHGRRPRTQTCLMRTPMKTPLVQQLQERELLNIPEQEQAILPVTPPRNGALIGLEVSEATPLPKGPPGMETHDMAVGYSIARPIRSFVLSKFSKAREKIETEVGFSRRTIGILECVGSRLSRSCLHMPWKRMKRSALKNRSSRISVDSNASSDGDTKPVLLLSSLVEGQKRDVVAAVFFELLALRSRSLVDLLDDRLSGIVVAPGVRYEKLLDEVDRMSS